MDTGNFECEVKMEKEKVAELKYRHSILEDEEYVLANIFYSGFLLHCHAVLI
jgi:hypothetical protein